MPVTMNGRADLVGSPLQIGDFFAERRQVIVNGEQHLAWVTTNRRYPRRIQGLLDKYRAKYLDLAEPLNTPLVFADDVSEEDKTVILKERMDLIDLVDSEYETFLTDAVMALVPSLDEQTVEVMSREAIETLLRGLGYLPEQNEEPVASVETGSGETGTGGNEEASPLTGAISTPDSAVTTQPTPLIDS